jgi:hypothetical protein
MMPMALRPGAVAMAAIVSVRIGILPFHGLVWRLKKMLQQDLYSNPDQNQPAQNGGARPEQSA